MKAKFLLGAGLLVSTLGFGQTSLPASAGPGVGTGVYIGEGAGASSLNSGVYNVFVGHQSGNKNESGYSNVFTGYRAGLSNTAGDGNVFIGAVAGSLNTIGDLNTFIGHGSGTQNITGGDNNFYGNRSGYASLGGANVFIGSNSGYSATGSNNACVGNYSGQLSGSGNVCIGYGAGGSVPINNKLFIDNSGTNNPLIYGDFDTKNLKFNATKVGIGLDFGVFPAMTTIPNASSYRLFVKGGILAEEVRIRLQADWADYVFADDYKLLSLAATEQYINKNGHLPNMPSAAQVKEEGIEMGNIIKLQQEKIEELTLHLIEQDKKMEELKAQVQLLLNKQ